MVISYAFGVVAQENLRSARTPKGSPLVARSRHHAQIMRNSLRYYFMSCALVCLQWILGVSRMNGEGEGGGAPPRACVAVVAAALRRIFSGNVSVSSPPLGGWVRFREEGEACAPSFVYTITEMRVNKGYVSSARCQLDPTLILPTIIRNIRTESRSRRKGCWI